MELKNARVISPGELHERRKQAVLLFKKGMKRLEIAEIVRAHRNTVGRWIKTWQEAGSASLKPSDSGRPTGSGRRLSFEQEREIRRLLIDKAPDQLKLPFALWTRQAAQQLIQQKYGVSPAIRTLGNYLKRWGFTPQKPVKRAYERCEKQVQRWLNEQYPQIAQEARQEGAEIHWGDETGLRSNDVNGRGYAPKGKTPVRRTKGTPEKINMISTVTNQGTLRFMFYKERMCADVLINFMQRLIKSADKKVYLILDNLRVHHAKKVKAWEEKHKSKIALFYLPGYSPDLNPDEYLNNDLKAGVSKKPDSRQKGKLKKNALSQMRSIQKQPARIAKYFQAEHIRYAA